MMLFATAQRGATPVIVGVLASFTALAQQAPATIRLLPEDAQRALNGHQHNFYFLPPSQTGENYQNAGFFGQRLRPYLAGNPEALGRLDDYRRQKTFFLLDRLVAVSSVVVYSSFVFEKTKFPQYGSAPQLVAAGVFATSVLSTIFINRNTNRHFQSAVAAYNAGKAQGRVLRPLRATGLGLGLNPGPGGGPTLALGLRW